MRVLEGFRMLINYSIEYMTLRCLFRFSKISRKPRPKHYPFLPKTIGEHLMKRRMDLAISKLEVSRRLNVTDDTIYAWETGIHIPYITHFACITEFLGYSYWNFDTTTLAGKTLDYQHRYGLTAKQFGKLIGVRLATFRRWERELATPPKSMTMKITYVIENTKPLD